MPSRIPHDELPTAAVGPLRIWVGGHNIEAKRRLDPILIEHTRPPSGPLDVAFITALDEDEALYFAAKLRSRLVMGGQLWIIKLISPGMTTALASLGYQDAGIMIEAGGITIRGFQLHSPTT